MARKNDVVDIDTSAIDVQGQTLFGRISDYLKEKDWSFSAYADKGYVSFDLRLRDGSVRVVVYAKGSVAVSINNNPGIFDIRKSLINSTLSKVLKRLHYPLEVMLTCVRWYVVCPLDQRAGVATFFGQTPLMRKNHFPGTVLALK